MDNIGLFDLSTGLFDLSWVTDDGPLILMPWAQEAYGVRTSDELLDYLEAEDKRTTADFERLMAEMDEHDRLVGDDS